MVVVTQKLLPSVKQSLLEKINLALDSETYGLGWDDKMFSLIIGDGDEQFYFNFNARPDHLGVFPPVVLSMEDTLEELSPLWAEKDVLWFMHNAKFDLRRLDMEEVSIAGEIHDTEITARVLRNDHLSYSLDDVAQRLGFAKDLTVEDYINSQGLYTMVEIPGKQTKVKNMHYDLVPFNLISPYGCTDVKVTFNVGTEQLRALGL